MKKIRLTQVFILIFFCYSSKAAKYRIDVYLSFNECINCYSSLSFLEKISNYEKYIHSTTSDSSIIRELITPFNLSNIKFIYDLVSPVKNSYVLVSNSKQKLDSVSLDQAQGKLNFYNSLGRISKTPDVKILMRNSKTNLKSDRVNFKIVNNVVCAYDYILNKCVLFRIDTIHDSLSTFLEIKGNQFQPRNFLKLGNYDTALFYSSAKVLKQLGKFSPHIEGCNLNDSSMTMLLNFPWVWDKKNGSDTAIDIGYFLYKRNYYSEKRELFFIDDSLIRNGFDQKYYIDQTRPFFETGENKILFSLGDESRKNGIVNLFITAKKEGFKYKLQRFSEITMKQNYYEDNKIDSFEVNSNANYYFDIRLKMIVSKKTGSIIELKNFTLPSSAYCVDIIDSGKKIKLLVVNMGKISVYTYDKAAMLSSEKIINADTDLMLPNMRFIDDNNILCLSNTSFLAYIVKIGKL